MANKDLSTPILFLIFNRLETTKQVFQKIRLARPNRLYIAADGHRSDRSGEFEKVQAVRNYVLSHIDWDCKVQILFREKNMGCRAAVSTAIDWFFEWEEAGIILEDDTVPDKSFFQFCHALLKHYKDDERVMSIVASNIQGIVAIEHSYFFSRYSLMWGWATWRRAWQKYDREMSFWPRLRETNWLLTVGDGSCLFQEYWTSIFDRVYSKKLDSWGFIWIFSCWLQNGLSVLPSKNLVRNVGYGSDATHTNKKDRILSNLRELEIDFPLNHPDFIYRTYALESYIDRHWFKISRMNNLKRNIRQKISSLSIKIIE